MPETLPADLALLAPEASREATLHVRAGLQPAGPVLDAINDVWLEVREISGTPTIVHFARMTMAPTPYSQSLLLPAGTYALEARAYDAVMNGASSTDLGDLELDNPSAGRTAVGAIASHVVGTGVVNFHLYLVPVAAADTWGDDRLGPVILGLSADDGNNDNIWDVTAYIHYTGTAGNPVATWEDWDPVAANICGGTFGSNGWAGPSSDVYTLTTTWTEPGTPPSACDLIVSVEEDVTTPPFSHSLSVEVAP
jgi:hypothetical protein